MHVGNLRSAFLIFNCKACRRRFLSCFALRIPIEAPCGGRCRDYYSPHAAGDGPDEGPTSDGGYGPYVQSERMKTGIYMKYAKELIEKGGGILLLL